MLKDFKNHSHVLCPETIEHSRGEAIIVERLDLIQNLENYEDKMRGRRHVRPAPLDMRDVLPPDIYHRYDTIVQYLEVSAWGWARVPPSRRLHVFEYLQDISGRHEFVSLLELGQTHEGRRILGVRVGRGELGGDTPTVLLDGGMHAREWITVATALNCEHTIV